MALLTALLLQAGVGCAFAQGSFQPVVLNTGPGEVLITGQETLSFEPATLSPVLQMKVGFGTDEVFAPGGIFDSFTVTLQSEDLTLTYVLATFDASGVIWAPPTPGTTPLDESRILRTLIEYPNLSPSVAGHQAFELSVSLPDEVVGRPLILYFDLFNNQDAFASQAWFADVVAVPEPSVGSLWLAATLMFWRFRRALRGALCFHSRSRIVSNRTEG